jgi:hypothetical protein
VQTEHLWDFLWKLIDFSFILITVGLLRGWGSETLSHSQLHIFHDLWSNQLLKVRIVRTSVPIVCNVASIHDLTEQILQVCVWHFVTGSQVVMEYLSANSQVTIVEVVFSGPALGSKLGSTENE